jgi:hypothetical protein
MVVQHKESFQNDVQRLQFVTEAWSIGVLTCCIPCLLVLG